VAETTPQEEDCTKVVGRYPSNARNFRLHETRIDGVISSTAFVAVVLITHGGVKG